MIKAMIFDFDGTIIDTETPWFNVFRDAYSEHGVELTFELYSQCIGTNNSAFNPYKYLITEHKLPIDPDAFQKMIHERYDVLMESQQIRPGIIDYLEKARAAGLRIGLATSSSREWIDKHMEALGIDHYFEAISTADDVPMVKPDPALYQRTLSLLGVEPSKAVAFEDSPNGARAAVAAGIHCIVIPNTVTSLMAFDMPHQRLGCLSELAFDDLLAGPLECNFT